MLDSLHKVPLTEGEVLLIEGGVPHAIGSGCFLIEIQEPTDYTLRVERTTVRGETLPDTACHQGAGFPERLLMKETTNPLWHVAEGGFVEIVQHACGKLQLRQARVL